MNKEENLRLWNAIDNILWNDWDPIGLKNIGGPRDEYHTYVSWIFQVKQQNKGSETIAQELYRIEQELFSLTGSYEHCLMVANEINKL